MICLAKSGMGQKHLVSELDLQLGAMLSHVLRHEGRTDGQGALGTLGGGEGCWHTVHGAELVVLRVVAKTVDELATGLLEPSVVLEVPPVTGELPGVVLEAGSVLITGVVLATDVVLEAGVVLLPGVVEEPKQVLQT